ncbi:SRPBCC family protein [Mycolicibacterium komossense]|uniref:SRPBCC family protein n=1 Tax=Mycolicibacterium komossense TaxID=1779 RepID=A0ABT3C982_9MYCO|nr:SRPBCC family protein [Mycolicibacterium komossense]MCV7226030.1 SRPBCC family protein [Mycolicibacterium komossense]
MRLALRQHLLTVERTMAVPAEAAWHVLTDLEAWPRWGPSVQRAELAGSGPLRLGSCGTVWTAVGIPLPFEITEFEDQRQWAWKIAGLAGTRHTVAPTDGGCRVAFGMPIWAPIYLTVCALALRRIEDLASKQV